MIEEEKLLIHRSALLTYKSCPYKAYLEYWYNDHGISNIAIPQHLLIGICIHRGLQHLIEHCRIHHPDGNFDEKCIDDAVDWAHKVFSEILTKRTLSLKYQEDLNYTIAELSSLIEAFIRVYAIYRLEELLEKYEVLEVEKEEVFDEFSELAIWLGKADGLLKRRRDNQLVVLSIKTASEYSETTFQNILRDMQGVSEIYVIQNRLNESYRNYLDVNYDDDKLLSEINKNTYNYFAYCKAMQIKNITILENQYEYLIKGKKRKDSTNPSYYLHANHLIHPIKNNNIASAGFGGLKFGLEKGDYEWHIPTGKLPSGKRKIDIWNDIGVKEWIARLAKGEIQPELGDPFIDIIIAGDERVIKRTPEQLREWRINSQFEAERIANYLAQIRHIRNTISQYKEQTTDEFKLFIKEMEDRLETKIMQFFGKDGKDKQLCYNYYGEECAFAGHCHQFVDIEDGIESGLFITREPHHQLERERFIEKGYLKG